MNIVAAGIVAADTTAAGTAAADTVAGIVPVTAHTVALARIAVLAAALAGYAAPNVDPCGKGCTSGNPEDWPNSGAPQRASAAIKVVTAEGRRMPLLIHVWYQT